MRLAAEEKARLEEIERQEAEEAKRKEAQKQLKKLREKQKIEEAKRQGTFKTKGQREAEQRQQLRLQQMLEAGGVKVGPSDDVPRPKKPVYEKKTKGVANKAEVEAKRLEEAAAENARKIQELQLAEANAKHEAEEAAKSKDAPAEESDLDDWEAQAGAHDGIKESWDAESDDDLDKKKTPNQPTSSVQNGFAKPHSTADHESDGDDSEEESEEDSSEEELTVAERAAAERKAQAVERRQRQHEEALAARSKDNLRSPIVCILGHVDTGTSVFPCLFYVIPILLDYSEPLILARDTSL